MVSVGVLAMVVNVCVLLTVAVADRAIERIVRNFATSCLHTTKRAPVVHDSDTWLPNIPRSIVKYHRHPAILITVLCTVVLISSELVTELGVEVAEMCNPIVKSGTVISSGDSSKGRTPVELGATAFFLQTITFMDGALTRVSSGMPKKITGRECLPCLYEDNPPDVVRNCHVRFKKDYPAGTLSVGVKTTDGAFGTVAVGFNETRGPMVFIGEGDLTGNGDKRAIFVVAAPEGASDKELHYLEYGSQSHADALIDSARTNPGTTVWEDTRSLVRLWSIQCDTNELSSSNFVEAVMVYRTIQLENPTRLARFHDSEELFTPISAEDVYRAVLGLKITDDDNDMRIIRDYYEYTTCARYKWEFLMPIVVSVVVVLLLGLWSSVLASRYKHAHVPHNSRSWYRHWRSSDRARKLSNDAYRSGYFDSIYEEMVLVDGGNGSGQEILFHSRSSPMPVGIDPRGRAGSGDLTIEDIFESLEPQVP